MNIRNAIPEDIPQIIECLRTGWISAYLDEEKGITKETIELVFNDIEGRTKRWHDRIEANDPIFVAEEDGEVIGVVAPKVDEHGKHRVGALYIHKDHQGVGAGRALLKKAIDYHNPHPVYLGVVSYNHNAKAFYEYAGFSYTGHTFEITIERDAAPLLQLPNEEMVMYQKEENV